MLRLPIIERPPTLLLRLAYWISRRRFGRVLTPFKVIYARRPALLPVAALIERTRERDISLEPSLRFLVAARASMLNECAFCQDLILAQATMRRIGPDRFATLEQAETSPLFTERERAALALVEDVTRTRNLSEATLTRVRASFTDEEIVELLWLNAVENYFNLQAHPLGIGSDDLYRLAQARHWKIER